MELDNIQQRQPARPARAPLTQQERTHLVQGNGCFYCHKVNVNHQANNCPEKACGAPRQVNVVQPAPVPTPAPAPAPAQA